MGVRPDPSSSQPPAKKRSWKTDLGWYSLQLGSFSIFCYPVILGLMTYGRLHPEFNEGPDRPKPLVIMGGLLMSVCVCAAAMGLVIGVIRLLHRRPGKTMARLGVAANLVFGILFYMIHKIVPALAKLFS